MIRFRRLGELLKIYPLKKSSEKTGEIFVWFWFLLCVLHKQQHSTLLCLLRIYPCYRFLFWSTAITALHHTNNLSLLPFSCIFTALRCSSPSCASFLHWQPLSSIDCRLLVPLFLPLVFVRCHYDAVYNSGLKTPFSDGRLTPNNHLSFGFQFKQQREAIVEWQSLKQKKTTHYNRWRVFIDTRSKRQSHRL